MLKFKTQANRQNIRKAVTQN